MDIFNKLFENSDFSLADVDKIVEASDTIAQSALAMSEDGAKAVVVLCLALAKTCADAKIPASLMVESILEMEEAYLDCNNAPDLDVLEN
jgi:phosphoribosylpyrophosphate synthetase